VKIHAADAAQLAGFGGFTLSVLGVVVRKMFVVFAV